MALSPCDIHGTRYRGAACHLYGAISVGQVAQRRHIRCCEPCTSGIVEYLSELCKPPDEAGLYEPLKPDACAVCVQPVGAMDAQAFLTLYLRGDDRRDFWFRFHLRCAREVQPFALIDTAPLFSHVA